MASYTFPPWPIIGKVIRKARLEQATMVLIAPAWPAQPWSSFMYHRSNCSCKAYHYFSPAHGNLGMLGLHACMASARCKLQSRGASTATLDLVSEAHLPSTERNYESMWSRWLAWSADNGVSPTEPRSIQLANFLAYLSTVLHLSASSVKMHRSAVRTTIRQLGGPSLSSNSVRDLIRGVNARQASQPRRMHLPLSRDGSRPWFKKHINLLVLTCAILELMRLELCRHP